MPALVDSPAVRSSMPSRSAKDLRKWKTERFLVIGKAILLSGAKNSHIATLVEHHSRFAMLIKVPSKETEAVAALSQHVRKLPATLKRSLTWDRGLEMAKHKDFTIATEVQLYAVIRKAPGRSPFSAPWD
jgi:IS30 family transposase